MTEIRTQSYSSYKRRQPVFHFFIIPVLITNLIIVIVYLALHPGLAAAWLLVLSIALLLLAFLTRINPNKVQDRLIRLEERLRLTALLPEHLKSRVPELTEKQLIALRFASDAEIPQLVEATLKENLSPKDIKQRIQNWRSDFFRV